MGTELFVYTILNSSLQTVRIFFRILGIGLELACNGGSCGGISFTFEKTPRMSLTCKLVPVQYREYEHGLLLSRGSTSL